MPEIEPDNIIPGKVRTVSYLIQAAGLLLSMGTNQLDQPVNNDIEVMIQTIYFFGYVAMIGSMLWEWDDLSLTEALSDTFIAFLS